MEREELADFIGKAARLAGLDIGEDEDITEKWREWSCDRTEKKGDIHGSTGIWPLFVSDGR